MRYLAEHSDSPHSGEAHEVARGFLSMRFTELSEPGYVLVTNGWASPNAVALDGKHSRDVRMLEQIKKEGTGFVFKTTDFQLRNRNTVLLPKIPCASVFIYDNKRKGVELYGFDVLLLAGSQTTAVFEISAEEAKKLEAEQKVAPRDEYGDSRMKHHSLACELK